MHVRRKIALPFIARPVHAIPHHLVRLEHPPSSFDQMRGQLRRQRRRITNDKARIANSAFMLQSRLRSFGCVHGRESLMRCSNSRIIRRSRTSEFLDFARAMICDVPQ
jgi:hypothetical protein